MRYLPDGVQMKAADRYTIEQVGIPSMELMERAAAGCVREMAAFDLSNVLVVCGSGNNGGDGFAIARLLLLQGAGVCAVFVGKEENLTDETSAQMEWFREVGGKIRNTWESGEYSVIVDAVFGVGLSREVTGHYREIIEAMNASGGRKVAVDIPSGISASTGAVLGAAFQADVTITFQAEKLGLRLYPGQLYSGQIKTAEIGIDLSGLGKQTDIVWTFEKEDFRRLMPARKPDSHKGTYGRVLLIAGSKGMAGAAYLGSLAAYRSGAGLVQIYTPEENRLILQGLLPEAILTTYEFYDEGELLKLLRWADAVCIGPGLGTSERSRKILRTTLQNVEVPCVVDADGLNLLSEHMGYLDGLAHNRFVLTPHLKEMSRMLKKEIPEWKDHRFQILKQFAEKYPAICVLKDSRTIVGDGDHHPYVNLSGNHVMAKGGSGDVLAGVITSFLAQGMECFHGAALGVYVHGLAGDAARTEMGSYGLLARELADYIGKVLRDEEEAL